MKRNILKIEGKTVFVSSAPAGNGIGNEIWMTVWEIADMFNVSGKAVNNAIKAIRKADVLNDHEVCRYVRLENGNTADVYSLEMIIPIAFRLNTYYTNVFRKWMISRLCEKKQDRGQFFIHIANSGFSC